LNDVSSCGDWSADVLAGGGGVTPGALDGPVNPTP